jgi:hypothetical protein
MTDSRQYRRHSGEYRAVVVADWAIWGIRANEQETSRAELLVSLFWLQLFATCPTDGLAVVFFFIVGCDESIFQNLVEVFFYVVVKQLVVIVFFVSLLALGPRCVLRRIIIIVVIIIVIVFVEFIFVELSRGIVDRIRIILFVGLVIFSHLVASV